MIHRRMSVPVVVASLWLVACGGDPPPPPTPTGDTDAEIEAARRADSIAEANRVADSIRDANAAAEAERRAEEARMRAARETLEEMVYFDYDESEITTDAERVLRQKVEILRSSPAVRLRIEGHADERGSTEYNLALGNRRAESVREFFTGFGLQGGRFSIVSYGEQRPLVNQSNESAWARNRRAEFVITAGQNMINPSRMDRDR